MQKGIDRVMTFLTLKLWDRGGCLSLHYGGYAGHHIVHYVEKYQLKKRDNIYRQLSAYVLGLKVEFV